MASTRITVALVLASCGLFSIVSAARPDDHRQAQGLIQMASSGHMVKEKQDLTSERTEEDLSDHQGEGARKAGAQPPTAGETAEKAIREEDVHIAKPQGALFKMPAAYDEMARLFNVAAKKVYDDGEYNDPAKNFIKRTALDWMNKVQDFKVHAGHLRKHADEIYQEIVRAHVGAGKEINDAFADEMRKLELMHKGQKDMQAQVQDAKGKLGVDSEAGGVPPPTGGSEVESAMDEEKIVLSAQTTLGARATCQQYWDHVTSLVSRPCAREGIQPRGAGVANTEVATTSAEGQCCQDD